MNSFDDFFALYQDLEPLTDSLIEELVSAGFPLDDLVQFRSDGFQYNRRRNSLVSPMEFE